MSTTFSKDTLRKHKVFGLELSSREPESIGWSKQSLAKAAFIRFHFRDLLKGNALKKMISKSITLYQKLHESNKKIWVYSKLQVHLLFSSNAPFVE